MARTAAQSRTSRPTPEWTTWVGSRSAARSAVDRPTLSSRTTVSHGPELGPLLHRDETVARAQRQLLDLIRDLLIDVAKTGSLRDDVAPDELANFCVHALTAAGNLPSEAAVRRLVTVTLAGLRPPPYGDRGHAGGGRGVAAPTTA